MSEETTTSFKYTIKKGDQTYIINKRIARNLRKFIGRIKTDYITGKDLPIFIQGLEKEKVNVVIDVRYNTFFKTKQGFAPKSLEEVLKNHNIEYFYVKDLGNPYHNEHKEAPEKGKEDYLNHLNSELYIENNNDLSPYNALNELYKKIVHRRSYMQKTFCLVCYYATLDSKRCHRFWLKEKLINLKKRELGLLYPCVFEEMSYKDYVCTKSIIMILNAIKKI